MLEIVESLLSNSAWAKACLRTNIAKPEAISVGSTGFKRASVMSDHVRSAFKQDQLLRQALSLVAPEWGDDTVITVNKAWSANRTEQQRRRLFIHMLLRGLSGR